MGLQEFSRQPDGFRYLLQFVVLLYPLLDSHFTHSEIVAQPSLNVAVRRLC